MEFATVDWVSGKQKWKRKDDIYDCLPWIPT